MNHLHRVTVRFEGIVYCDDESQVEGALREWLEQREYFRIVLGFEVLSVTIYSLCGIGNGFEIEARAAWDIDGLADTDLLPSIFKTIFSQVCGPTDTVVISRWDHPIAEKRIKCTP